MVVGRRSWLSKLLLTLKVRLGQLVQQLRAKARLVGDIDIYLSVASQKYRFDDTILHLK